MLYHGLMRQDGASYDGPAHDDQLFNLYRRSISFQERLQRSRLVDAGYYD